jgi:hypothetical protein
MTLIVDKRWKKSLYPLCGLGMKYLISFLNYQKIHWDYTFHASEPYSEHCNTSNSSLAINHYEKISILQLGL